VRHAFRVLLLAAFLLVPAASAAGSGPAPEVRRFLYVAPTAGVQIWDQSTAEGFTMEGRGGFMWGARAGITPTPAFSIEALALTGTNTLTEDATGAGVTMRITQLEASFLINFQSFLSETVYPFLCLGAGAVIRRANAEVQSGDPEDSHVAFHLGGGIRASLAPRWALRFTAKDTFFSQSQGTGNEERQVTVDTLELSLALEARFHLEP
jgi:hypothetical protein